MFDLDYTVLEMLAPSLKSEIQSYPGRARFGTLQIQQTISVSYEMLLKLRSQFQGKLGWLSR